MATTYEPIATTTLSSAAASITLSSIPQTYTDLRVVALLRGTNAATTMSYDYDTNNAADWFWTGLRGDGATATSFRGQNGSNMSAFLCPGGTSTSGLFSMLTVDLFSYTNSTNYKTTLATSSRDMNGSGRVEQVVTLQIGTTAINSFTLNASNTFAVGTTVTIYGIKAA